MPKSSKPLSAAEKKRLAEEEAAAKQQQHLERLLPWEAENKVSCLFSVIKVPFILFVGFFGALTEWQVRSLTMKTWSRDHIRAPGAPSCYVHRLDMSSFPEHTEYSLIQFLNTTLLGGSLSEKPALRGPELEYELAHRDMCGFFDTKCQPDSTMTEAGGGATHLLPMAMMWMIYKLAFIGVHPIDRLAKKQCDKQPYLKLLSEPYFQSGLCRVGFFVFVKTLFYIRYRLMPNVMLAALATMEIHPSCKGLLRYRYDWFWSSAIYILCILDLFLTFGLYGLLLSKDAKLIGTWCYRMYKTFWFITSIVPVTFVFWGIGTTVQWNIFKILRISFRVTFTFDISFAFYVDFLQAFLFFVIFLEFLEWNFLILQICCPAIAKRLPCQALDQLDWFFVDERDDKEALAMESDASETEAEAGSAVAASSAPARGVSRPASSASSFRKPAPQAFDFKGMFKTITGAASQGGSAARGLIDGSASQSGRAPRR